MNIKRSPVRLVSGLRPAGPVSTLVIRFASILLLVLGASCDSDISKTETPAAPSTPAVDLATTTEPTPTQTPGTSATPASVDAPAATTAPPTAPEPVVDTWARVYGGDQDSVGTDLLMLPDGGFFIVGGTGSFEEETQPGGVLLIRTDPSGEVLWQKVYGGDEYDMGWTIIQMLDGMYFIAGETSSYGAGGMDIFLIKVDEEGNEYWSRTYGGPEDEFVSKIVKMPDGGYLLVGNTVDPNDFITDPGAAGYAGFAGRSNVHLVKVDAEGNELWTQTYESEENIISSSAVQSPDGGVVILSTVLFYPDYDSDMLLMKIDSDGQQVWTRRWEEGALSGYNIYLTSENQYLITGISKTDDAFTSDLLLLKLNLDGEELWRTFYGDPERYESGKVVMETATGEYVILGQSVRSLYTGESETLLVFFDRDGNLLRVSEIDLPRQLSQLKVFGLLQHPDGGFIVCGTAAGESLTYNTILLKTGADGMIYD